MPLAPFSAIVDERFRIKLSFDTNILMYLLDCPYPKLNDFVLELRKHTDFVELITNRYAIFELYEKRKEEHFIKKANHHGFGNDGLNSDKFYIRDKSKYQKVLRFISMRSVLGDRIYTPLSNWGDKYFKPSPLTGNGLFFSDFNAIMRLTKSDIPRILDEFGINTVGSLHDNLWSPTFELIFHSRISREDSLVAIAFLRPDLVRSEKNLVILTNDGDFQKFYSEAQDKGLIEPLFDSLGLQPPVIDRISKIQSEYGKPNVQSLKNNIAFNVEQFTLNYVKKMIITNNEAHFIGYTDKNLVPRRNDIIGIDLIGDAQYNVGQNLLLIGANLDFIYTIPQEITSFVDRTSTQLPMPIRKDPGKKSKDNKVVFQYPPLAADDLDKAHEPAIMTALKESGNLVFVNPN